MYSTPLAAEQQQKQPYESRTVVRRSINHSKQTHTHTQTQLNLNSVFFALYNSFFLMGAAAALKTGTAIAKGAAT